MLSMKLLIICMFGTASAKTAWHQLSASYTFDKYCAEFGKGYETPSPEYFSRKERFESQLSEILAHNMDETQTWKAGVNEFTDWTDEELTAKKKGLKREMFFAASSTNLAQTPVELQQREADLPTSVDWRNKNVVTPVKNQGGCGSCWAFSATEVLESAVAIKTGKLLELAPQELVDCAPNPKDCGGTGGCQGSTQWLGFNYTATAGMATADSYKYKGRDGECQIKSKTVVAGNTGYTRLPANDYESLLTAVATVGPIAISVDASWGMYETGVFSQKCGTTIDHAVVAVGYGTDPKGGDYWLVRNSWGPMWGEDGYIRIARSAKPKCGVDKKPADGTGCKGGPKTMKVCGECGILSDSSYPTGAHLIQ